MAGDSVTRSMMTYAHYAKPISEEAQSLFRGELSLVNFRALPEASTLAAFPWAVSEKAKQGRALGLQGGQHAPRCRQQVPVQTSPCGDLVRVLSAL